MTREHCFLRISCGFSVMMPSRRGLLPESPSAPQAAAEALGTAFLLAAVVGSGIMAQRLAGGNQALLCNTLPTGRS
jgi:hypothetical protein